MGVLIVTSVCPKPSVMNLVLVVLWSLAMPYSRFRPMASCLSTVWVCVIIVCKMLYQLSVVNPVEYSSTCNEVRHPYPYILYTVLEDEGEKKKKKQCKCKSS